MSAGPVDTGAMDPAVTYFGDFTLTAMPVEEDGERPDLHVSVEHRVDAPSLVALWQEARDGAELEMTAAEAREVAAALLRAADDVDGVGDDEPVVTRVCDAGEIRRNLDLYVEHARQVCGCGRKPKTV